MDLECTRARWVQEGKLGEKREIVIGTAAQLEAQSDGLPTSLSPRCRCPTHREEKTLPKSQMPVIRIVITTAQMQAVAGPHRDTKTRTGLRKGAGL